MIMRWRFQRWSRVLNRKRNCGIASLSTIRSIRSFDDRVGHLMGGFSLPPLVSYLIMVLVCQLNSIGLFKAGPDDPLHTVTYGFARGDLSKPALALWSNQDAGPSVAIRCNPLFYKLRPSVSNVSTLPYRFIFAVITLDRVLIYDTQVSS